MPGAMAGRRAEGGPCRADGARCAVVIVDPDLVVTEIDDVDAVALRRPLEPVGMPLAGSAGAAQKLRFGPKRTVIREGEYGSKISAVIGDADLPAIGAQGDVARISGSARLVAQGREAFDTRRDGEGADPRPLSAFLGDVEAARDGFESEE